MSPFLSKSPNAKFNATSAGGMQLTAVDVCSPIARLLLNLVSVFVISVLFDVKTEKNRLILCHQQIKYRYFYVPCVCSHLVLVPVMRGILKRTSSFVMVACFGPKRE